MSEPCEPGLVSVIIPVYNRSTWLDEAVRSVIHQTWRPVEVILVDDGSTDDTPDMIASLVEQHPEEVRSLRIENRGAGGAREAGRQAAKGAYLQYLDSDDRLCPEKFAVQVQALKEHPECAIAYGITRLIDAHGKVLVEPYKWTDRKFDTLFPALLVDRWWNTHTPLWRREICDAIGPWTPLPHGEDWEYEARAGGLGAKLVHTPLVLSETRQHDAPRLTGSACIDAPLAAALCRVQEALLAGAVQANVSASRPEMRHFSRWAFALARHCGTLGLPDQAEQGLDRALRAAESDSQTVRQVRSWRRLVRVLGWKGAGRLVEGLQRISGRRPGAQTLAPAIADPSHERT